MMSWILHRPLPSIVDPKLFHGRNLFYVRIDSIVTESFPCFEQHLNALSSFHLHCLISIDSVFLGHKVCFVFSLSGVLFLSVIAILLGKNSLYIKVSNENFHRKKNLSEGVAGAAFMWLGCLVLSGYLWYRAAHAHEYIDEDQKLLE